jgi:hypothetical protein
MASHPDTSCVRGVAGRACFCDGDRARPDELDELEGAQLMHASRIIVDLPSAETDRRRSPLEWLRSLFGAELDLRSGREELTVGALWLIEGLVEGFAAAGVHDVSAFVVDRETVYEDAEEDVSDDLRLLVRAAEQAGVLDREFHEMSLTLVHRGAGLHTTIDCRIKNGVLLGEAEMTIVLSGLPTKPADSADAAGGEGGADGAGGEGGTGGAGGAGGADGQAARHALDALSERVASELTAVLPGARVRREAATVAAAAPRSFS